MNVAGIVAEYNPFHRGHEYHILKTKEALGEDALIVSVMSGDFVQRGQPAAYSKYVRAEAACRCGADLVIELPLVWSVATAESFAVGAVSILDGVGCTHLSFGSESGDVEALTSLAAALDTPDMREKIDSLLAADASLGYAQARQRAADMILGPDAGHLRQPNNILAVEYLKAIRSKFLSMKPITVRRFGSEHDGRSGELKSAAELRAMLETGEDISPYIPPAAAVIFASAEEKGCGSPDRKVLEAAILSRLRFLSEDAFGRLPGAAGGLGQRLYRAARTEASVRGIVEQVKTKRYTDSRIRRMLCCAALGIDEDMQRGEPPYARVLAADPRGRAYLSSIRGESRLPILTKPAAVHQLGLRAEELFSLGAKAHDLFALGFSNPELRRGDADWRKGPTIL